MGAKLGAFVRVEAALEQRAEDAWVHGAPVERGNLRDPLDLLGLHIEHRGVGEEVAVEVKDFVLPEQPAVGHRFEELGHDLSEEGRVMLGILQDAAEKAPGQQADVLGEEAEDHPVQEVRHVERRQATLAHGLGNLRKVPRRLGGDGLDRDARLELLRLEEDVAQEGQVLRLGQVGQRDLVFHRGGVGEVRADDNPFHVAHDHERRVLKCLGIAQELLVGGVEVLVLALVLPAEEALLPDVGKAVAAGVLLRAALEGEGLAGRVHLYRLRMAQQPTQAQEMLLIARPLGQVHLLPDGNELCNSHHLTPLGCSCC